MADFNDDKNLSELDPLFNGLAQLIQPEMVATTTTIKHKNKIQNLLSKRNNDQHCFICSVCDLDFNSIAKLQNHRKKLHGNGTNYEMTRNTHYRCKQCKYIWDNAEETAIHIGKRHPEAKTFTDLGKLIFKTRHVTVSLKNVKDFLDNLIAEYEEEMKDAQEEVINEEEQQLIIDDEPDLTIINDGSEFFVTKSRRSVTPPVFVIDDNDVSEMLDFSPRAIAKKTRKYSVSSKHSEDSNDSGVFLDSEKVKKVQQEQYRRTELRQSFDDLRESILKCKQVMDRTDDIFPKKVSSVQILNSATQCIKELNKIEGKYGEISRKLRNNREILLKRLSNMSKLNYNKFI